MRSYLRVLVVPTFSFLWLAPVCFGQEFGPSLKPVDSAPEVRLGMSKGKVFKLLSSCCLLIPLDSKLGYQDGYWVRDRESQDLTGAGEIQFEAERLTSAKRDWGQFGPKDNPIELAQSLYFAFAKREGNDRAVRYLVASTSNRGVGITANDTVTFSSEPGRYVELYILDAAGGPKAYPQEGSRIVTITEVIDKTFYFGSSPSKAK